MPNVKEKRKRRSNNMTVRLADQEMRKLDKVADALFCTRSKVVREMIRRMKPKEFLEG